MILNKFEEYFKDKHEFLNLDLSLSRIDNALKEAEFKVDNLGKVIHIAGTNGKGSTSNFLNQMLLKNNYKTALFTSPHILRINERINFNNEEISNSNMDKVFLKYKDIISRNNLSYFEAIFFIGILFFSEEKPDYTILETGMGGLFDATNTTHINNKLCVIVSMGQDHSNYLGKSIKQITNEKLGIIRSHNSVIVGSNNLSIKKYISENSKSKDIYFYNENNSNIANKYALLYPYPYNENYELSKIIFQKLMNYEFQDGFDLNKEYSNNEIKNEVNLKNIIKLNLPSCRMEEIRNIVIDGTHNIPGLLKIINTWKNYDFKHVIISITNEKDITKTLFFVKKIIKDIIVTTIPNNIRSLDSNVEGILKNFQKENSDVRVRFIENPVVALDSLMKENLANKEIERILITGSFYLCGYLKEYILNKLKESNEEILKYNQLYNTYNSK